MKITEASLDDVTSLNLLVNNAYRGASSRKGWTTEADLIEGNRTDESTIQQYIEDPDSVVFKATDEEEHIIGCVHLKKESTHVYLGMLTVSPLLQANGIGKRLLHAAEEQAYLWRSKKIIMTVISDRIELLNWYEKHGYHKTGKKQPFHDNEKFGRPKKALELLVLEKPVYRV